MGYTIRIHLTPAILEALTADVTETRLSARNSPSTNEVRYRDTISYFNSATPTSISCYVDENTEYITI